MGTCKSILKLKCLFLVEETKKCINVMQCGVNRENPVTPGASRWTACAFLKMKLNEKLEVALFRITLMHLLLRQGLFLLPAQSHMQRSIPISVHAHLKSGSLYNGPTMENILHFTFVASS